MQIRPHSASFVGLALLLVPLLAACNGGDDDGQDENGETTGTTSTGMGTEGPTDDMGTEGTTGTTETDTTETDTTETDTTETDTTETDTGDPGDPDLTEGLCMEACALIAQCEAEDPDCVEVCIEVHGLATDCLGSMQALTGCVAGLTCEEYDQYLEGEPEPYPCQAEEEQLYDCEDQ